MAPARRGNGLTGNGNREFLGAVHGFNFTRGGSPHRILYNPVRCLEIRRVLGSLAYLADHSQDPALGSQAPFWSVVGTTSTTGAGAGWIATGTLFAYTGPSPEPHQGRST